MRQVGHRACWFRDEVPVSRRAAYVQQGTGISGHEADLYGRDRPLKQATDEASYRKVEATFLLVFDMWSEAGSNRRPSAFQAQFYDRGTSAGMARHTIYGR